MRPVATRMDRLPDWGRTVRSRCTRGQRGGRSFPEVLLAADGIRLDQPPAKLIVYLICARDTEGVQMIARRERLHRSEARRFQSSREHHVAVEPMPSRRDLRERHADLKRDPCLL